MTRGGEFLGSEKANFDLDLDFCKLFSDQERGNLSFPFTFFLRIQEGGEVGGWKSELWRLGSFKGCSVNAFFLLCFLEGGIELGLKFLKDFLYRPVSTVMMPFQICLCVHWFLWGVWGVFHAFSSFPWILLERMVERFLCFLFLLGESLFTRGVLPDIGLAVRVFANGPGDLGSIPGRVIPKTQKMVLDASLLNTQHYKVRIKGKVEQSRERSSALPYTLV